MLVKVLQLVDIADITGYQLFNSKVPQNLNRGVHSANLSIIKNLAKDRQCFFL